MDVLVASANETLGQATNYSYSVDCEKGGASSVAATAASPFGVAYAVETLLQITAKSSAAGCDGGFSVTDAPEYVHRGLLLDTGRRFFP